jgi:DNA-binding NarL/FixJ family response regulator
MEQGRQPAAEGGRKRMAVVDDHELVRAGIRNMLAREPDLEVVGEAANGREAVELCHRERPDLVLMDVRMPEMDGLTATRAIKREYTDITVLILTVHENPDYLFEALKAGAAGYVLKDTTKRELLAVIRQVLDGETPLNPKIAARLLRSMACGADGNGTDDNGHMYGLARPGDRLLPETLTPREVEVLRHMAEGMTNPEIAKSMMFSVHTVKVHVRRIIAKLGVSDRTQAAVRAIELGLLTPPRSSLGA